eukprot:TRINITY_DN2839_c0_g2_i2.p1 TRINITY_DN2839_c0_g2~~TRINITY_DN2839_c0_g2_i2.p1  ORF type:complete len:774 (+),score=239.75 TRINITY_DN2839_c0_g2_i2:107-2428(+)
MGNNFKVCCGKARSIKQKFDADLRLVPQKAECLVTVDAFLEDLNKSGDSSSAQAPAWIDQLYTEEMAVLVSDLSGFTSTTRRFGIIHFASIIARKRQICLPILKHRGALRICTEADNLLVIFPDLVQAGKAAVEMQAAIAAYNASLDEWREHFKIRLNGIGVDCGKGIIIDKSENILGKAFRGAYHLGEDLCEDGVVLFSEEFKNKVETHEFFAGASFDLLEADVTCYTVKNAAGPLENVGHVDVNDSQYLVPGMLKLAQRHDPKCDIEAFDKAIQASNMKSSTVLMFHFDLQGSVEDSDSVEQTHVLDLKFKGLNLIHSILQKHSGHALEEMLYLFDSPVDAVLGALGAREAVDDFNSQQNSAAEKVLISGWGIHSGPILMFEGTDIHWGDPVNTSSKLGQDLATDGTLLVMPGVKELAESDSRCSNLSFEEQNLVRSNVGFQCYSVQMKPMDEGPAGEATGAADATAAALGAEKSTPEGAEPTTTGTTGESPTAGPSSASQPALAPPAQGVPAPAKPAPAFVPVEPQEPPEAASTSAAASSAKPAPVPAEPQNPPEAVSTSAAAPAPPAQGVSAPSAAPAPVLVEPQKPPEAVSTSAAAPAAPAAPEAETAKEVATPAATSAAPTGATVAQEPNKTPEPAATLAPAPVAEKAKEPATQAAPPAAPTAATEAQESKEPPEPAATAAPAPVDEKARELATPQATSAAAAPDAKAEPAAPGSATTASTNGKQEEPDAQHDNPANTKALEGEGPPAKEQGKSGPSESSTGEAASH